MKSKVYRFETFSRNDHEGTPSQGGSIDNDKFDTIMQELELLKSHICLLYTSPSPRDLSTSRMPSSA